MNRFGILFIALFLAACATSSGTVPVTDPSATSGTHVRLMYGMGGEALSPGIDTIGAKAAQIPGVTMVKLYDFTATQQIADEVNAEPLTVKEVIVGYSCGANAAPVVGAGITRSVDAIAVIQASIWCVGTAISANVKFAQETYNPVCWQTIGLGCKLLDLGPGFNPNNFLVIDRPDCHPCADTDPNAQADVLSAITRVASGASMKLKETLRVPGAINHITRYNGQKAY